MCVCVCVCEALQNKGTVYCANLLNKVNNKDIKNLGHTVLLYFVQIIIDTRPNEYVSSCMSFSVIQGWGRDGSHQMIDGTNSQYQLQKRISNAGFWVVGPLLWSPFPLLKRSEMCRDRLAADREGGWIEGKQKMKLMKSFPCGRVLVMAESQRVQRDEKSTTYA